MQRVSVRASRRKKIVFEEQEFCIVPILPTPHRLDGIIPSGHSLFGNGQPISDFLSLSGQQRLDIDKMTYTLRFRRLVAAEIVAGNVVPINGYSFRRLEWRTVGWTPQPGVKVSQTRNELRIPISSASIVAPLHNTCHHAQIQNHPPG